ncbi:MAG: IspD/TarI family cytidylyltransferase [Bacillota bacterium]
MVVGMILAAGSGSRFGTEMPKQFLPIENKPVLQYVVEAFLKANCFDSIILVLSRDFFVEGERIIKNIGSVAPSIFICEGGKSRQDSVYNGTLKAIEINGGNYDNLKIVSHCGARPAIPIEIILENLKVLTPSKCVNTVGKLFDTLIYETNKNEFEFIDREKTFAVLTPQSFFAKDYCDAYEVAKNKSLEYTCVCSLMTANGVPMETVISEYPIKKITVKSDISSVMIDLKYLGV